MGNERGYREEAGRRRLSTSRIPHFDMPFLPVCIYLFFSNLVLKLCLLFCCCFSSLDLKHCLLFCYCFVFLLSRSEVLSAFCLFTFLPSRSEALTALFFFPLFLLTCSEVLTARLFVCFSLISLSFLCRSTVSISIDYT